MAVAVGIAASTAQAQSCVWGDSGFSGIEHLNGPVDKIAGGYAHVLVLKGNGTVAAWGSNIFGESNPPAFAARPFDISAGRNFSAALLENGQLIMWGDPDKIDATPGDLGQVIAMDCGRTFMTAVKANGTVVVWGDDANAANAVPPGLSGVVSIAASSSHAIALKSDGSIVAWGTNSSGQCNVPAGLGAALAIDAGPGLSIALLPGNKAQLWGVYLSGEVSDVVAIAAGGGAACMLHSNGNIERYGTLPEFTGVYAALQPCANIAVGQNFYISRRTDGTFVTRGPGTAVDYGDRNAPPSVGRVVSMAIDEDGENARVISTDDGRLISWETSTPGPGSDPWIVNLGVELRNLGIYDRIYGQQPNGVWRKFTRGDFTEEPLPADVANATAMSFASTHGLALLTNQSVVPVGVSNPESHAYTQTPANLGPAIGVEAGPSGSIAVKPDGSLVYWGNSAAGQGAFPASLNSVASVSLGAGYGAAVKSDGTGVYWGGSSNGNSVPPSGGPFRAVAAGPLTSMWLRIDGSVEMRGSTALNLRRIPAGLAGVRELMPALTCSAVTSVGPFPWDLNGDGTVDGADLGQLLGAWGQQGTNCVGDLNGDHTVDGADLGALLGNWGATW